VQTGLGALVALAVVAGIGSAALDRGGDGARAAPPGSTSTANPGNGPETSVAPIAWARGLRLGAAPEVPFLAGTTVVQPDGVRVPIPGTGVGVIGLTVAGLVLLVESEVDQPDQPYSMSSRYVLVTSSGEVQDLPVSTLVADGAQEAVISPDGLRLTGGGDVLDVRDLSVVGEVPEQADILYAWTSTGILFGADHRSYLWTEDGETRQLAGFPGIFPNGTDVGMRAQDGNDACGDVLHMSGSGAVTALSSGCIPRLWAVSPSGRWALTYDLRLVDVRTGRSRFLAGGPAGPPLDAGDKVRWDGERSLLFPVGTQLVRCHTATATCERAGPDVADVGGRDDVLALP
jgi:hypothetical protein